MRGALLLGVLALMTSLAASVGCEGRPPKARGCLSCHAGIEQAHPSIAESECVVCHGGNAEGSTKEEAHVPVPANWALVRGSGLPPSAPGFIRDMAPDQLDALDPAFVRFINPGDIRAAAASCGPCHAAQVANMPASTMTTNIGHYWPTLWLAGLLDEPEPEHGSYPVTLPDCTPSAAGESCSVATLAPASDDEIRAALASGDVPGEMTRVAYSHYLAKNCNTCHQAGYPRNDSPALYRSTGCSSCHMVYDKLGVYRGGDPTLARGTPVHPARHELTRKIPSEQCATCHFQGGRIGLLFRGIREGGFNAANTPENAEPINETLYGHTAGYYFTDEDTTNDVDETPPDLHYAAGLHCVDCHTGVDVHGDGRMWNTSKLQMDLRCEDCHGTVRSPVSPDGEGRFLTSRGNPLKQLSLRGSDVVLTSIVDGTEHVVPQAAARLSQGDNRTMVGAMGPMEHSVYGSEWSHTDSLTCDTCHTSYNQICVGCHVSYDLRLDSVDYQTGVSTTGLARGGRSTYTLSAVLLGTAPDGRVQSVVPSQQVQLSVFGSAEFGLEDGQLLVGGRVDDGAGGTKVVGEFRHGQGFAANNGFVPFFQHTSAKAARSCESCHRRDDTPEELARVRGVYGYGTGEFLLTAPDGSRVDGMRFLADDGTPLNSWFHAGTGPVEPGARERALAVRLDLLP